MCPFFCAGWSVAPQCPSAASCSCLHPRAWGPLSVQDPVDTHRRAESKAPAAKGGPAGLGSGFCLFKYLQSVTSGTGLPRVPGQLWRRPCFLQEHDCHGVFYVTCVLSRPFSGQNQHPQTEILYSFWVPVLLYLHSCPPQTTELSQHLKSKHQCQALSRAQPSGSNPPPFLRGPHASQASLSLLPLDLPTPTCLLLHPLYLCHILSNAPSQPQSLELLCRHHHRLEEGPLAWVTINPPRAMFYSPSLLPGFSSNTLFITDN